MKPVWRRHKSSQVSDLIIEYRCHYKAFMLYVTGTDDDFNFMVTSKIYQRRGSGCRLRTSKSAQQNAIKMVDRFVLEQEDLKFLIW